MLSRFAPGGAEEESGDTGGDGTLVAGAAARTPGTSSVEKEPVVGRSPSSVPRLPGAEPKRIVVVGGGVAGCAAALAAAREGASVLLLTKLPDASETNTRYAQGGIIYSGPEDSPDLLVRDILAAGGGNKAAAETLAGEGPPLVRRLLIEELGVPFDREERGFEGFHLTREGAHSVPRILHHRDATGREIQVALARAVRAERRVAVLPGAEVVDLATTPDGRCAGVHAVKGGETLEIPAGSVVLATGGLGALYEHTTNPPGATGGGHALALRAGAEVRGLHFVQFHPTALYSPDGDRFLVSEAVRGEGGVLLDANGEEFIEHPLGSLAARDVVAREIRVMMDRTGSPCALLDITHRSEAWLAKRFPTIHARCLEEGINMAEEPVPVVPAAHYSCGGVVTDLHGRTSVPGLLAAGEVADNGLHGHNRLASTSLLEGLLFGWRAGKEAAKSRETPETAFETPETASETPETPKRAPESAWRSLRRVVWERAGLVRDARGLLEGLRELDALGSESRGTDLESAVLVARALVKSALGDRRSRGCHYRLDGESREDEKSLENAGERARAAP